jgi:hypothetical protein
MPGVARRCATSSKAAASGPERRCSRGASGADIIAAEPALERGVAVRLVRAREPVTSCRTPSRSLRGLRGAVPRARRRADVEIVGGSDDDVHVRTNERIIERDGY